MTYTELNQKLNLTLGDYEQLVKCADKMSMILDRYPYKTNTEYRDSDQMSKRDKLKNQLFELKMTLLDMESDC